MLANTLYNLHHYIRAIGILYIITYDWKYNNIMNSCNFILLESEEMKSCTDRVETANAGIGQK